MKLRWRNPVRPCVLVFAASVFLVANFVVPATDALAAAATVAATGTSPLETLQRTAPRVLTGEDAAVYRRIFAAQRKHHWRDADILSAQLNDRLLMGHVLQERYLARSYKPKYSELAEWLAHFGDQPGAEDVYELAKHKAGKGAAPLPKPQTIPTSPAAGGEADDLYPSEQSAAGRRWQEGLRAWQASEFDAAARAFGSLARARGLSSGMEATAAFWAARAEQQLGDTSMGQRWLERAAEHPTSFYGLLAAAQLGQNVGLNWHTPTLSDDSLNRLRRDPGVRRTIALVQIGQPHLAEEELDAVYARKVGGRKGALLALATSLGLPQAQLRISSDLSAPIRTVSAALYPMPFWAPTGGFKVDPAFLFALMRQESKFDALAESRAGARGIMQIMPATARLVARRSDSDGDALFNPIVNMTLGQRYIEALQSDLGFADPLTLAVAYNLGPTALRKTRKKMGRGVDPLLFIETFSPMETRLHAKRVLASFWIYCMRFQRSATSLQAMAVGKWPGPLPKRFPERNQAFAAND